MTANIPKNPFDIDAWFAALDQDAHVPFKLDDREQPVRLYEAAFLKLAEEAFADWKSKDDDGAFSDL